MSEIKDGGSAFPREDYQADCRLGQPGLTLRDYFAAKALQAEIITTCSDATPESAEAAARSAHKLGRTMTDHLALNAYQWADSMLRARKQ